MIQKILHPTDFSESSQWALQWACHLAQSWQAPLLLAHVAPPPVVVHGEIFTDLSATQHQHLLKEQLEQLALPLPNLRVERVLVVGDPAHEVVKLAKDHRVDLIVMGTHGRTGLRRFLLGSVAEHVVRQAHCAVLTVKGPLTTEPLKEQTQAK